MRVTYMEKSPIAQSIRDELGQRTEDGEPGKELVKWLNGLSDVKSILRTIRRMCRYRAKPLRAEANRPSRVVAASESVTKSCVG